MHFARLSTTLTLALALKASASPLPQDADPAVAAITSDGSSSDPIADFVAVYEDAASQAAPPTSAPVGDGEEVIQVDPTQAAAVAADTASTNTTSAADAVSKRSACDPEPTSTYTSSSNAMSVSDWVNSAEFSNAANAAQATYAKYSLVPGWRNKQAAALANVYMGYTTVGVTHYDPYICAVKCDQINGCTSFVVYFERDPAFTPGANCPNPQALTRLKCAFYGIPLSSSLATNTGQQNYQFLVRMAGSNAYTNEPATPGDFVKTDSLGSNTIVAPNSDNSYLGVQTFANTPYDPTACAAACKRKTQLAASQPNNPVLQPCNFFVAYMTYKNGQNPLLSCNYYSKPYDSSYAQNTDFTYGADRYTKQNSYSYTIGNYQSPQVLR